MGYVDQDYREDNSRDGGCELGLEYHHYLRMSKPDGQFWIGRVILRGKLGGKEILAAVGVEEEGGGKGNIGETRAEGTT